jgi:hypothetical protein
VLQTGPDYLAYTISFLTIGGAWLLHTALTDQLARTDPLFLRRVLLVVVFLPFPTHLVANGLADLRGERVCTTPCTGSHYWQSASSGPPWMPTPGTSSSTRRARTTRSCTETGGTSCPSSSRM